MLTRRSLFLWTLIIMSYLFAEWVYNQHLLLLLHYPTISAAQFEWTEIFGKALAATGINLMLYKCYRRPHIFKFLLGVVVAYVCLSSLFNWAVDSFSDDFRHSSYYSVLHRSQVIDGLDKENILAFAENEPWYIKSLVLSQFYLTLQDSKWKTLQQSIKIPNDLGKTKDLWSEYKKAEEIRQYIDTGWDAYESGMSQYNRYRDHPRHAKRAKEKFKSTFRLEPDLTREQFVQKMAPPYHKFLNSVVMKGDAKLEIPTILGKDLPLRMNEKAFNMYVTKTLSDIRIRIAPTREDIQKNAASRDAVALLVLPPLSIGLSLLSVLFNIALLFYQWIILLVSSKRYAKYIRIVAVIICMAPIVGLYIYKEPIETSSYWTGLTASFGAENAFLSRIIQIPMRMETILCTTEPVEWIQKGMYLLYKN